MKVLLYIVSLHHLWLNQQKTETLKGNPVGIRNYTRSCNFRIPTRILSVKTMILMSSS